MRVLSVGEALIDLVAADDTARFDAHPGGSPYNVALTLGRLGADASFLGQCGSDPFGALLVDRLRAAQVRLDQFAVRNMPTSLAVAALDSAGIAEYSFYFAGTAGLAFDHAVTLPPLDVVHAGSIASWLPPAAAQIQQILADVRAHGSALISYDPNVRLSLIDDLVAARSRIEQCISLAHVVKASDDDCTALYPDLTVDEVIDRWLLLGATVVAVTRGAQGAAIYASASAAAPAATSPAPAAGDPTTARLLASSRGEPLQVVDTVGAGDSFAGGLLWALGEAGLATPASLDQAAVQGSAELAGALDLAVTVSTMTVERAGANPPTAAEVAQRRAKVTRR